MSNNLDASDDYLSLWAIWCHYDCFSTKGGLIPYGRNVQNPKDREEEDDEEAAGAATATATATAVGEEIDCVRIYSYSSCSCLSKEKKKSTINTIWSGYYILNQINDMKLMWEESKEEVFAQRSRGASIIAFSGNVTPTPTPTPLPLPQTKTHSTDGDTPISMYPFRWVSYHIQYTYNSSHKINLFSLQYKIK